MESLLKNRDLRIDSINGLMILWMMLGHVLNQTGYGSSSVNMIGLSVFYFFMPWFFFKAGLLYKGSPKSIVKLIKSLLIWFSVGYIIRILTILPTLDWPLWKWILHPIYVLLKIGDIVGNEPLWFLVSLILVQAFGLLIIRVNAVSKSHLISFMFILVLLGWYIATKSMLLPLGIHNFPLGMAFFVFGSCIKIYMKNYLENMAKWIMLLLSLGLVLLLILAPSFVDVHTNKLEKGNYLVFCTSSAVMIILLLKMFPRSNLMAWISKNALVLFGVHFPIINLVVWFIHDKLIQFIVSIISILVMMIGVKIFQDYSNAKSSNN